MVVTAAHSKCVGRPELHLKVVKVEYFVLDVCFTILQIRGKKKNCKLRGSLQWLAVSIPPLSQRNRAVKTGARIRKIQAHWHGCDT